MKPKEVAPEKDKNLFAEARKLALRTTGAWGAHNQTVGLLSHYIALRYKTRIEVEGQGEYEIEVTNLVDTRTFKERQIVPSLMNMANIQKIEANRCKRLMQKKGGLKPLME